MNKLDAIREIAASIIVPGSGISLVTDHGNFLQVLMRDGSRFNVFLYECEPDWAAER